MYTVVLMLVITLFLISTISLNVKYNKDGNESFFSLHDTKIMRGFWCVVIMMVHVPIQFQNRIQDLIGSFAYIGVTFFFMTSGYGLLKSISSKNINNKLVISRLFKILMPNWITNIVVFVVILTTGIEGYKDFDIFHINPWIYWLLFCYIIVFTVFSFNSIKNKTTCIVGVIFIFSVLFYILKVKGLNVDNTWYTEIFGFIWGILLYKNYNKIKKYFIDKWYIKTPLFMLLSSLFGVLYVKEKTIPFLGDYLIKIVLGLAITCFVLSLNSKITLNSNIGTFLGEISFEIYLSHSYIYQMVGRLFPTINSGVFIMLSMILTIVLSFALNKISKIIMKSTKSFLV